MSAPDLSPVVTPEPTTQYAEELQERIDPQDVTRPVPLAPSPAVTLELLSTPPSAEKLAQVAAGLVKRFFHRQDVLSIRTFQGKPHPGVLDDEDTLLDAVRAHVLGSKRSSRHVRIYLRNGDGPLGKALDGHFRLGAYQLDQDSTVAWLCIDFDGGAHHNALVDPLAAALQAHDKAQCAGLPCYLERSGGGSGWHLWVFFAEPVAAQAARSLGLLLAPDDAPCVKGGVADPVKGHGIEVFPKQVQLPPGGLGNMVWLPLWSEAAEGANHFYRPEGEGRLVQYLPEDFDCATMEQLERALAKVAPSSKTQAALRKESPRGGVLPAQGMHLAAEPASPLHRAVDRYISPTTRAPTRTRAASAPRAATRAASASSPTTRGAGPASPPRMTNAALDVRGAPAGSAMPWTSTQLRLASIGWICCARRATSTTRGTSPRTAPPTARRLA